jgi:signal transduction histidine kinase
VHGVVILKRAGALPEIIAQPEVIDVLVAQKSWGAESEVRTLETSLGPALLVYEPGPEGGVAALVRVDAEVTRARALSRMMGLYMAVGGVGLLLVAYLAVTRWIVRPILELSRAADRIVEGGKRIEPLKKAPRELTNLSTRLSEMTQRLRDEEDSLRAKVDELTRLTAQLEKAQDSLVRSERLATVGRLSAGLAHEVGNPISALMGLQDLMIEGGLSEEEERDFLERMRKETTRIHRVLSDLLAYARPAGNSKMHSQKGETGSVASAIENALALLLPQSDLQEMQLQSDVQDGLPQVMLSEEELMQILLNLLMNAVDACEKRGRVGIQARRCDEGVELCVEDDGPGVDRALRDSLFEPFVSSKDVGKGTGLGLSVTKGLVEGAGGSIQLEDSSTGGARFVLILPSAPRENV